MRLLVRCRATFVACALLSSVVAAPAEAAKDDDARYRLANGCYALKSSSLDRYVVQTEDGYRASTDKAGAAEPFRMQATALGNYLLYGKDADFMDGAGEKAASASEPSPTADWVVQGVGKNSFTLAPVGVEGKFLAVDPATGDVVMADKAGTWQFQRTVGCAHYPESETGATGTPARGESPDAEVRGFMDTHLHAMAFEFLGGRAHCGRPWHPYGIAYAMVDCPDHGPQGATAALEYLVSDGQPVGQHDTTGWPTFADWPAYDSLTHEQTYWKFMERAWMGGMRLYVNLLVDNAVLCEIYPYKQNSCNEMDGVRLQHKRILEFQDYIDAQYGGPGRGWFRIVTDPFEARRVINEGKLAVVLGIEVSKLFDCGEFRYEPDPVCTTGTIEKQLDEVYGMGVRQMELVNKFDNALTGVAGDSGSTGMVTNTGNFYETGHFLDMRTCDPQDEHVHDKDQTTAPGVDRDPLVGQILTAFGDVAPGATPLYPAPHHCNNQGLTDLGAFVIDQMMGKQMIFDPDHMSVKARQKSLDLLEARNYPGVVSSHSWSTRDAYPRILKLGGVVTPAEKSVDSFIAEVAAVRAGRDDRFFFGTGYSTDMNGFARQGPPPKPEHHITYPFKSFDGGVTLDKQRSGERLWDLNADGVAHWGMYPDQMEAIRRADPAVYDEVTRGVEAYLQMWERTVGVAPATRCQSASARVGSRGVGRVRLQSGGPKLLRAAGQPVRRRARVWSYCVSGSDTSVRSVMTRGGSSAVIVSSAPGHKALGVGVGDRARRARSRGRSFGPGVVVRRARGKRAIVFVLRRGRVAQVGVASAAAARTPARLRSFLKLAR